MVENSPNLVTQLRRYIQQEFGNWSIKIRVTRLGEISPKVVDCLLWTVFRTLQNYVAPSLLATFSTIIFL
jgi:hypothetical protein